MISVILPSRGRPDSLRRAVSSLAYGDVEILVGLDADDPTAMEAVDKLADLPHVKCLINERMPTIHHLDNHLAKEARGDWLMFFTDDYTVNQVNWVNIVEDQLRARPDGLTIGYPHDPMYPMFSVFPIIPRKLYQMAGYFAAPLFPFLFADTWWNEVGVMSGLIVRCDISVTINPDTGHFHSYKDLGLWSRLFDKTRPLRVELAIKMVREAFGESELADNLIASLPIRRDKLVELHAPQMTQAFFDKWDNKHGFSHPHYDALKTRTEEAMTLMEAA